MSSEHGRMGEACASSVTGSEGEREDMEVEGTPSEAGQTEENFNSEASQEKMDTDNESGQTGLTSVASEVVEEESTPGVASEGMEGAGLSSETGQTASGEASKGNESGSTCDTETGQTASGEASESGSTCDTETGQTASGEASKGNVSGSTCDTKTGQTASGEASKGNESGSTCDTETGQTTSDENERNALDPTCDTETCQTVSVSQSGDDSQQNSASATETSQTSSASPGYRTGQQRSTAGGGGDWSESDSSEEDEHWGRPWKDCLSTIPYLSSTNQKRKVRLPKPQTWSSRDTLVYRSGYPGKPDHPSLNANYEFYMNKQPSYPDGDFIDMIHGSWWGQYYRLESHHGYIQWLFPIREPGMNFYSQELQLHEIEKICANPIAHERILKSYEMMLHFYGMKLADPTSGRIERAENWQDRFRNLNRSMHNYLRITRILKSLGEFKYEHLKSPFVRFVLREAIVKRTLTRTLQSCLNYWLEVVKDDKEREDIRKWAERLANGEEEEEEEEGGRKLKEAIKVEGKEKGEEEEEEKEKVAEEKGEAEKEMVAEEKGEEEMVAEEKGEKEMVTEEKGDGKEMVAEEKEMVAEEKGDGKEKMVAEEKEMVAEEKGKKTEKRRWWKKKKGGNWGVSDH